MALLPPFISRLTFSSLDAIRTSHAWPWADVLEAHVRQARLIERASGSVFTGPACSALQAALKACGWHPLADDTWGKLHPLLTATPAVLDHRLGEIAATESRFTVLASELRGRLQQAVSELGDDLEARKLSLQALERDVWPTKVIHDDLPSFIVPVGVNWVQAVFGEEVSRQPPFGTWSVETGPHVQVLDARPGAWLQPGARLLWVQRPTGRGRQTRLVGCSVLEEVHCGTAKEVLHAFGHLPGVTRSAVQALAGEADARLTALVCGRPEVFTQEVTREQALAVGLKVGGGRTLSRLPLRISGPQFAALYTQGIQREEAENNLTGERGQR